MHSLRGRTVGFGSFWLWDWHGVNVGELPVLRSRAQDEAFQNMSLAWTAGYHVP